jgi:hypothetical protein
LVRRSRTLFVAASFSLCAVAARADIVSTGSGIEVRAPVIPTDTGGGTGPASTELDKNEYESDTKIRVWFESRVQINQSMALDHVVTSSAGTGTINSNGSLNPGTIASGTRLDSYYLLFDPATNSNETQLTNVSGSLSITFDTDILGLCVDDNGINAGAVGLNESDDGSGDANGNQAFQGPGGLTYKNGAFRGFELGTGTTGDRFSISSDRRTITILNVSNHNDYDALRIFVAAAVPEPATVSLFGAGVVGMLWLLRNRRRGTRDAKASG